ncbi:aspartyl protease family protein [Lacinutrix iliipiscaria]|uniref:Aspartyl protease family protein n=1 Tax=Lacinutrix iliipiscaria TaxID=1230532 RepID=A0ABW5WLD0_9FLAO
MKKKYFFLWFLFSFCTFTFSQSKFVIQNKKNADKIKFKLINNLILIPVEINGVELSFILDTGVSKPIVFNILNVSETLKINNTEKIFLRGLGEGEPVEALRSRNNIIKIGDAINVSLDLYAVYNSKLNFAPRLGMPVHGIIGYDFFKDFIVEINYSGKYIKIYENDKYQHIDCKNCETLSLDFFNKKPYIQADVTVDAEKIPVKLLIDSGGSDALWLFKDKALGLTVGEKSFEDFLGHGLNGSVYGQRSKMEAFSIKSFKLPNANVAFPDSTSISFAKNHKDRNGSLAGNILKRFNIIIDYKRATIQLKKSKYFNEPFSYNKSGIELEHNGIRLVQEEKNIVPDIRSQRSNKDHTTPGGRLVFSREYRYSIKPAFVIVELRKDSPAEKVGLRINDVILRVNSKDASDYTLQEVTQFFYEKAGKTIRLKIDRDGEMLNFQFKLESVLE